MPRDRIRETSVHPSALDLAPSPEPRRPAPNADDTHQPDDIHTCRCRWSAGDICCDLDLRGLSHALVVHAEQNYTLLLSIAPGIS